MKTPEEWRKHCAGLRGGADMQEQAIIADYERCEAERNIEQKKAVALFDAYEEAKAEAIRLRERLKALECYVRPMARCPCCDTFIDCLDDCTYREDDEQGWSNMMQARYALKEEPVK